MALGIGDTLRESRRRQNRFLGDAATSTRVREVYLAALEEEQFDSLGGDVYVKGFLRSYARYLGLDAEPLVDLYRQSHQPDEELPLLGGRPVEARPSRSAHASVLAAVVGVLLAVLAVIGSRGADDVGVTASATATQPADTASVAPAVTPPAATVPPAPPAPVPFTTVQAVVTVAGGPNYLRVEQGTPPFEGEMVDGERREFTGAPALELRLGNAGVVSLGVDGQDQGSLGRPGQVVDVICAPGATACTVEEITP